MASLSTIRFTLGKEAKMDWMERITSDPNICHGKACVKGTRIMVSVVLANIAAGQTLEAIKAAYPRLDDLDIRACLSYAAELAKAEDLFPLRTVQPDERTIRVRG